MSGLQTPAKAQPVVLSGRGSLYVVLALLASIAVWALLFLPEIQAAVETWRTSTAYGHCFLVLPMSLYLLWDRRDAILTAPIRPSIGFAALALPIAAGWLLAERLGIMEGRQLMAIAALQVVLMAVLGQSMFRVLAGPLLYLFFLVPFGMFLTPALQHFTARFASIGLDVLGIPNYADDLIIQIPAGVFLVAEACAGLRFLIASVAFGVFYALLNYRTPLRRAGFVLASIVVPVVANGFRALGIVVLGNILGSAQAAAADHIIYGWVFFSLVMLLLVVAGMPFRQFGLPATEPPRTGAFRPGPAVLGAALASCLVIASGPATARLLDRRATPGVLAALPNFRLPPGCRWAGALPAVPTTRAVRRLRCDGFGFDVAMLAFPPRSTAAPMRAERLRLSGELAAENTSFSAVPVADDTAVWTLAQTYMPFGASAVAGWIDGHPAAGGLSSRIEQARDSLLGSASAPVLIGVTLNGGEAIPSEQRQAAIDTLRVFIQAQAGLTAQIAALSRQ